MTEAAGLLAHESSPYLAFPIAWAISGFVKYGSSFTVTGVAADSVHRRTPPPFPIVRLATDRFIFCKLGGVAVSTASPDLRLARPAATPHASSGTSVSLPCSVLAHRFQPFTRMRITIIKFLPAVNVAAAGHAPLLHRCDAFRPIRDQWGSGFARSKSHQGAASSAGFGAKRKTPPCRRGRSQEPAANHPTGILSGNLSRTAGNRRRSRSSGGRRVRCPEASARADCRGAPEP